MPILRSSYLPSSSTRRFCLPPVVNLDGCCRVFELKKKHNLVATSRLVSSPRLTFSPIPASPLHRFLLADCRKMHSAVVKDNTQCHASQGTKESDNDGLLLVSDLDFTMVDHNEPSHAALLNFNCLWAAEYAHNSSLVYSTGRSLQRYLELRKEVPLLTPGVVILSVGTEIRSGPSLEPDKDWEKALDDGWDRDIIVEEASKIPDLRFQEEPDQGPHKVSFKLETANTAAVQERLSARLQDRGLNVKLLYSSGIDLDVLPYKAGKGQALAYLLSKWGQRGCTPKNILVCGDSGNDIDLFTVEGITGVIVSNAQEELVEWHKLNGATRKVFCATQRCARGIIQALEHFCLGPYLSPFDRIDDNYVPNLASERPGSIQREIVEFNVFITKWLSGELPNKQETFQRLSGVIGTGAKFVHPWGDESSLQEFLCGLIPKHGTMKEMKVSFWFDNIQERKLAEGVHLVTWQPWEQVTGGEKRGYFATAILTAKEGTPNGVEWLHFHETLRKSG